MDTATACQRYCAVLTSCTSEISLGECMAYCLFYTTSDESPSCRGANIIAFDCLAGLTCDEFRGAENDACRAPTDAAEATCTPVCSPSILATDTGCTVTRHCEAGPDATMTCDGQTCSCALGPTELIACADQGVCALDLAEAAAASEKCCLWDYYE